MIERKANRRRMKNDLKRKFSLNSSAIFSVVELSKWVLSSFIYYLVDLLSKIFYYLSFSLSLSIYELFIFPIPHFFRVRLYFKFIIWFHFRFSFHFSIHSMIAFFFSSSLCLELRGVKVFPVVAIVLPFDFSISKSKSGTYKRIQFCWCKSLSLWQNKLKNKNVYRCIRFLSCKQCCRRQNIAHDIFGGYLLRVFVYVCHVQI